MGKKGERRTDTRPVSLRLGEEDVRELDEWASAHGLKRGAALNLLVREQLGQQQLAQLRTVAPQASAGVDGNDPVLREVRDELAAACLELHRVGVNLNQIVRLAHLRANVYEHAQLVQAMRDDVLAAVARVDAAASGVQARMEELY